MKSESWFVGKINTIDQALVRLTKKKEEGHKFICGYLILSVRLSKPSSAVIITFSRKVLDSAPASLIWIINYYTESRVSVFWTLFL